MRNKTVYAILNSSILKNQANFAAYHNLSLAALIFFSLNLTLWFHNPRSASYCRITQTNAGQSVSTNCLSSFWSNASIASNFYYFMFILTRTRSVSGVSETNSLVRFVFPPFPLFPYFSFYAIVI